MLDHIRDAKKVKIEGEHQDIEVFFEDGTRIFAQAKACSHPWDTSNAGRDLTKALVTLSKANASGHAKSLVFVTNRPDPFDEPSTMLAFSNDYSPVQYQDLPPYCQQRILDICARKNIQLPTDLLSVLVLKFMGDGKARYQTIKEHIADFLVAIDDRFQGYSGIMLEKWQLQFWQNASQTDIQRTIKKKEMMWPLIVLFCEKIDHTWLDEYPEGEQQEIEDAYGRVISDHSERFSLVAQVMTEYDTYKLSHMNQSRVTVIKSFISEKTGLFADEFDLDGVDKTIALEVQKLVVRKILFEQTKIKEVKAAVNL